MSMFFLHLFLISSALTCQSSHWPLARKAEVTRSMRGIDVFDFCGGGFAGEKI